MRSARASVARCYRSRDATSSALAGNAMKTAVLCGTQLCSAPEPRAPAESRRLHHLRQILRRAPSPAGADVRPPHRRAVGTAAAMGAPQNPCCAAEASLQYDGPICDPHHHFIDTIGNPHLHNVLQAALEVNAAPGTSSSELPRFLPEDYAAQFMAAGVNVTKSVYMEVRPSGAKPQPNGRYTIRQPGQHRGPRQPAVPAAGYRASCCVQPCPSGACTVHKSHSVDRNRGDKFRALIGILSQKAGPSRANWADPVTLMFRSSPTPTSGRSRPWNGSAPPAAHPGSAARGSPRVILATYRSARRAQAALVAPGRRDRGLRQPRGRGLRGDAAGAQGRGARQAARDSLDPELARVRPPRKIPPPPSYTYPHHRSLTGARADSACERIGRWLDPSEGQGR
jgi:hypothetical protein